MALASLAELDVLHRQHDEVLTTLLEVATRYAAGRPAAGDPALIEQVVVFFETVVPRHFTDEEGSVFPRLSTRRPELAGELANLSAEHPYQIQLQGLVAAAARALTASDHTARPVVGKTLLDAATRLAEAHRAHVSAEDALFAAAHLSFTSEDDTEILAEMETRRDRDRPRPKVKPAPERSKRSKPSRRAAPAAAKKATKPAATKTKAPTRPAANRKSTTKKTAEHKPASKKPTKHKPASKKPVKKSAKHKPARR